MKSHRQRGFTLIEVLVALAIFGVLTVLAYMVLGQTLTSADFLNQRMARLQKLQMTMHLMGSDLMQTTPRSIRLELGDSSAPALLTKIGGDFALEVTHGGWSNPLGNKRATIQRSAYRVEDGKLMRYYWPVLDRTVDDLPIATVLLDRVDSLTFKYLQANGEWTPQWPPDGLQGPAGLRARPRAAEITLTLTDEGELRRIVEIAP